MDTEHYVTLFDANFLPQGLALHSSLEVHAGSFVLWVLCLDDDAFERLSAIACETINPIRLADVETAELARLRSGRTRAEYCWTLTPWAPKLVFERDPRARRVTYLDADMYLLQSPRPIFDEFERSGKSVLITDHAYDAEYDQSATSGRYCVQFITFERERGEPVRAWWEARCIEWCFARVEDGKFGDQRYLDDWPARFSNQVHVLRQLDALLAPWNARRFPYSSAVAWHFHGLRLLPYGEVRLHAGYRVPVAVDRYVYGPYLTTLRAQVERIGWSPIQAERDPVVVRLLRRCRSLLRALLNGAQSGPEDERIVKL